MRQVTGIILSSFGWTYALMQLPGGWLVDKLKPRKVVSASLIGWGVIEGLTGLANSVTTLIGMRMLLGVFEGPVQNGANASLTRWLRRERTCPREHADRRRRPAGQRVRRAAGHQPDHLAGHLAVGVRRARPAHRPDRHRGLVLHAQPAGRPPPDHARGVGVPREDRRHRGIQRAKLRVMRCGTSGSQSMAAAARILRLRRRALRPADLGADLCQRGATRLLRASPECGRSSSSAQASSVK